MYFVWSQWRKFSETSSFITEVNPIRGFLMTLKYIHEILTHVYKIDIQVRLDLVAKTIYSTTLILLSLSVSKK